MKPIHIRLRNARRDRGMSQIDLARAADCKQSAISMMESGRSDALSREKMIAIAGIVGVEMEDTELGVAKVAGQVLLKICPIADCPSNTPYMVSGQLMFLPQVVQADANGVTRCVFCGEVHESSCSACGAAIRPGACCESCGNAYISPSAAIDHKEPAAWAAKQMENVIRIRGLIGRATTGVKPAELRVT